MSYASEADDTRTRRGKILGCVWRLVDGLLFDDNEEADGLAPDEIETALAGGELSVDDVVACFREALVEGLRLDADAAACVGKEAGCLLIYRGEE